MRILQLHHMRFCKCFTTLTQSELFIVSTRTAWRHSSSNFRDSRNFNVFFVRVFQFLPTCYFLIFSLICPTLVSFFLPSLFRPWRSMSLWDWGSVRVASSKTPIRLRRLPTAAPTLSASRECHHVDNCLTSAGCFWFLIFSFHIYLFLFSQVYRGAVSGLPGNRVLCLGPVGEPHGSCCHDSHLLYYRLSETQIRQKIHLTPATTPTD